jgi:hypothetical protein
MVVNVRNGRHGQFSVATLYSEIGNYVVRYEGLDQYDEGTYEGKFLIRDTDMWVRQFGVGKIIEPVAFVNDMMLNTACDEAQEKIPEAIIDPIDEETPKIPSSNDVLAEKKPSELTDNELKQLFGSCWPLANQIKLDSTVGRKILRAQIDYLKYLKHAKSIVYILDSKNQTWNLETN